MAKEEVDIMNKNNITDLGKKRTQAWVDGDLRLFIEQNRLEMESELAPEDISFNLALLGVTAAMLCNYLIEQDNSKKLKMKNSQRRKIDAMREMIAECVPPMVRDA